MHVVWYAWGPKWRTKERQITAAITDKMTPQRQWVQIAVPSAHHRLAPFWRNYIRLLVCGLPFPPTKKKKKNKIKKKKKKKKKKNPSALISLANELWFWTAERDLYFYRVQVVCFISYLGISCMFKIIVPCQKEKQDQRRGLLNWWVWVSCDSQVTVCKDLS